MTDRTGLGPLELAVLRSVSATAGSSGRHCRTTKTLEYLDSVESIGPAYGLPVLKDLGSSWRVQLPLLDLLGNWGSVFGDPMADPQYTEVRLSPIGELALLSEEYAVGPVPIGLVNGSLYRGGQAPPLDPARALQTVGALIEDDLIPDRRHRSGRPRGAICRPKFRAPAELPDHPRADPSEAGPCHHGHSTWCGGQ